jgi:hypothetical protein
VTKSMSCSAPQRGPTRNRCSTDRRCCGDAVDRTWRHRRRHHGVLSDPRVS